MSFYSLSLCFTCNVFCFGRFMMDGWVGGWMMMMMCWPWYTMMEAGRGHWRLQTGGYYCNQETPMRSKQLTPRPLSFIFPHFFYLDKVKAKKTTIIISKNQSSGVPYWYYRSIVSVHFLLLIFSIVELELSYYKLKKNGR